MAAEQTVSEVLHEHIHQIRAHCRKAGMKMRSDEELDAEMDRKIAELKAAHPD
jgi:hypothetical protein